MIETERSTTGKKNKTYHVPVYKVVLVRDGSVKQTERPLIRTSGDVARLLAAYLDGADREHFVVFLLNAKNKMIGINTVSMGSLTSSIVHPREVFKPAILASAAALILAHNHPSGDTKPSQEDLAITERIKEVGETIGVHVLDHIILGEGEQYCSPSPKMM